MYLFSKGPIFQILISHRVKLWPFLKRSSKKSIRFWMADQPTIQKVGKAFDHPIQYWFLELFSIPCSDLHKIVCYIYFTKNSSHSYLKFNVPFSTIIRLPGLKKYEITTINLKTTNPYLQIIIYLFFRRIENWCQLTFGCGQVQHPRSCWHMCLPFERQLDRRERSRNNDQIPYDQPKEIVWRSSQIRSKLQKWWEIREHRSFRWCEENESATCLGNNEWCNVSRAKVRNCVFLSPDPNRGWFSKFATHKWLF